MSLLNNCFVILLFVIQTNLCLKEFLSVNKNSIYQFHCIDHFHIRIHSIQYFYDQYNCTSLFHRHHIDRISNPFDICANRSACIVNLKSWLILHERQRQSVECHSIKVKHILFNYTCVNVTNVSMNISSRIPPPVHSLLFYTTKNTVFTTLALGVCIIGFLLLIACVCSSGRRSSTIITVPFDRVTSGLQTIKNNNDSDTFTSMNSTWNDTYNSLPSNLLLHLQQQQFQEDNSIVQGLNEPNCRQLKRMITTLSLTETSSSSSSSSTSTTLNNKNIITNPSEYDNLISNDVQQLKVLSPFHPNDTSGSRLPSKYPMKVTFNENCHFK